MGPAVFHRTRVFTCEVFYFQKMLSLLSNMAHGFHVTSSGFGPIKTRFQVTVVITFLKLPLVHTAFITLYMKGDPQLRIYGA
jgi:hypothetical protein